MPQRPISAAQRPGRIPALRGPTLRAECPVDESHRGFVPGADLPGISLRPPKSLRVFGRLPGTGARGCTEAGVRKASREETAGGVRTDAGVDLWGFGVGA